MGGTCGRTVEVPVEVRVYTGLFEDKKRCGMVEEDRCVLCNGWKVEDVKHFVLECEEFDQDRCRLLERIKGIVGAEIVNPT